MPIIGHLRIRIVDFPPDDRLRINRGRALVGAGLPFPGNAVEPEYDLTFFEAVTLRRGGARKGEQGAGDVAEYERTEEEVRMVVHGDECLL